MENRIKWAWHFSKADAGEKPPMLMRSRPRKFNGRATPEMEAFSAAMKHAVISIVVRVDERIPWMGELDRPAFVRYEVAWLARHQVVR